MAKQVVTVELYYSGTWHELVGSSEVLAEPIVITVGQSEESPQPRPATVSMTLDNRTDKYRISNPESALYGLAGRNSMMRVKVAGSQRAIVNATTWTCGQTNDFRESPARGRAWTEVTGAGLLQRIGQWSNVLKSAMTEYLGTLATQVGFFPMEDAQDATSLANLTPGGKVGVIAGDVLLNQNDEAPGAGACVKFASGGVFAFKFLSTTATGWQLLVHFKLDVAPPSGTYGVIYQLGLSNGNTVVWQVNNANNNLIIKNRNGVTLSSTFTSYAGITLTEWTRFRLKASVSGGTVTYEPAWSNPSTTVFGATATYAASAVGALKSGAVYGSGITVDAEYSHIFAITDTTVNLTNGFDIYNSFKGYLTENAISRFVRLCNQSGIPYNYVGLFTPVMGLGVQKPDTFLNLLQEIGTSEDGLLFDTFTVVDRSVPSVTAATVPRVALRTRQDRYNQTPKIALATTDMALPPGEVTDDLNIHNIVTAQQREGASAVAEDSTTPFIGSADPPSGAGQYRHTVDVNIADTDDLLPTAYWWLGRGTVDEPRFPRVVVDLVANTSIITAVESIIVGDVIEITGYRENTIRLQVIGWTETIETHRRKIEFNCVPDNAFQVGVYGTTRFDVRDSVLNATTTTTATSMTVGVPGAGAWSTADEPYDWKVAGERVTATVVNAEAANAQASTVTRSVNGVVKTHAVGDTVDLADRRRWAIGVPNTPGAITTGQIAYADDVEQVIDRGQSIITETESRPHLYVGSTNITPVANTATSVTVSGLDIRGASYYVVASAATTVPGSIVKEISYSSVSSTGVTLWIYRTNTSVTSINYYIIGMP